MGWVVRGIAAAVLSLLPLGACSSEDVSGGSGGAGGQAGGDAGSNPCFEGAFAACSAERSACAGEPGCVTYEDCIEACPISATGLDAACEASCPKGQTSAAEALSGALGQCVSSSAATCAACGAVDAGTDSGNPWLNQQCTDTQDADACNECLWDNCCDSQVDIFQGGPATDLASCWLNCTTAACEQDCYAQYPDGIQGLGGWWACLTVKCMPTGACPAQSACTECGANECSLEFADCETNVDCHLIKQCVSWCETSDCVLACPSKHPAGKPLYDKYFTCITQSCATSCN